MPPKTVALRTSADGRKRVPRSPRRQKADPDVDARAAGAQAERERIAEELHRTVQQSLTACDLFCSALVADLATAKSPQHADAVRLGQQVRQALIELRAIKRASQP